MNFVDGQETKCILYIHLYTFDAIYSVIVNVILASKGSGSVVFILQETSLLL